ncbi:hypothetical protein PHJA_000603900 [Phtheirospermum japonicum]|uniref:Uncharacterized protein n=1 Tax=Phtheirospermum japonicum TaxID=374723 RepID=A0A830BA86_9LAMI|nr:hypothetical protein PHJA_000603900 [Phtheirospermum japonicum]
MAKPLRQSLVWVLVLMVVAIAEATPPGIANNPSHARCLIKKYKLCYNLEHVCPKFCPDSCTVECVSCKPICSGGSTIPPPDSDPALPPPEGANSPPKVSPPDEGKGSGKGDDKGKGDDNGKGSEKGNNNGKGNDDGKENGDGTDNGKGDNNGTGKGSGKGNDNGKGDNNGMGKGSGKGSDNGKGDNNGKEDDNGKGGNKGKGDDNGKENEKGNNNGKGNDDGKESGKGDDNGKGDGKGKGDDNEKGSEKGDNNGKGNDDGKGSGEGANNGKGDDKKKGDDNGKGSEKGDNNGKGNGDGSGEGNDNGKEDNNGKGNDDGKGSGKGDDNGKGDNSGKGDDDGKGTPKAPTPSPSHPASPTPQYSPTPTPTTPPNNSSEAAGGRRKRCQNKNYPQCYGIQHVCPSSCPNTCEIDCVTCKPVCKCDMPGAVCQDPRFIGGDGITFYFHGKKDRDFCLVTEPNLHINAHFIGRRNENMKRDFTWVQSIAILFGDHQLYVGAHKTATWNDVIDRLSLEFDGQPIVLPAAQGSSWQPANLPSAIMKRDSDTNSVIIEVDRLFQISAKVVPITQQESKVHNYGITEDDCFAHLELGFKFFSLSEIVNGILGQTYKSNYVSRVKMGVPMPVLGGEKEFAVSSLFSTDCAVSQFQGGKLQFESGLELSGMKCSSGIDGKGVVCKR